MLQVKRENKQTLARVFCKHYSKKVALSFTFCVLLLTAKAQDQHLPVSVIKLIPKGYEVLNSTSGDLNLDKYPDFVVVLNKANEKETSDVASHPEKRPLLIFLGGPGSTYHLAAKSNNTVYCVDCGGMMGDPFTGITIKHGYFSVEHYGGSGWRWTRIITFKYSATEKNWFLYKDGSETFHATDPENVKEKVRTVKNFGKVPFARFDIYKD